VSELKIKLLLQFSIWELLQKSKAAEIINAALKKRIKRLKIFLQFIFQKSKKNGQKASVFEECIL